MVKKENGSEKIPKSGSFPVLPIKNSVLFPNVMMPLVVGRPASVAAVEAAIATEDKMLLVVAQNDPTNEEPTRADLFDFGTLAVVSKVHHHDDTHHVFVYGCQRVRLGDAEQTEPYLTVQVHPTVVKAEDGAKIEALQREILDLIRKFSEQLQGQLNVDLLQVVSQAQDPLQQAYMVASLLNFDVQKCRQLLAISSCEEVLRQTLEHLSHEWQVLQLRQKIASSAQSEMSREQREYFLRQQLRAIREELGEQSPEEADAAELRRRLDEADLPENVLKEAEKELSRLERMSPNAADYQLTRTYLDLVLELPWKKTTEDNLDLKRAREVLDEDHFNLKEVKERIVEHLAVMKLNPEAKAPILCFVGPPGVGKTSLGQSIARALDRKFERLALGGLHDEAELRGHRRTYIGAMPGRIIQAIRRAGVKNPLLMLDEVDKLGRDYRGDPAAALMEILDPEQNREFHDNYLDLSFDLSKVFFITTANTLDNIPRPLLDRMELLRLAGYSSEEKEHIARRYLIPRQIKEAGLVDRQLTIPDESLRYMISRYTREAGVRELERALGRIARKVAARFVERGDGRLDGRKTGETETEQTTGGAANAYEVTVRPDDLTDMLGPERYYPEKARKKPLPGVAAGLAWTESGGDVLYVEAVLLPEGKDLKLTGHLGDIMKESAEAARSYIWSQLRELGIDSERFRNAGVHVHVPAGATPKDGPSAGVTMATALASLYTDLPVRSDTAMTGEITLTGLVLPVGGVKEKVLAAHRAGMRRVILPKENEKDLRDLPEHVRKVLDFILVERVEDVLQTAVVGMEQNNGLKLV